MLVRKNVNNDVSKDLPIGQAKSSLMKRAFRKTVLTIDDTNISRNNLHTNPISPKANNTN